MIDLKDKQTRPTLEEIGQVVRNPIFTRFCDELKDTYQCTEAVEYSACSLEPGWNVKFKKAGKALCTIYPRELYVTVMVVVGRKEAPLVEAVLSECTPELQAIYHQTKEGNGQRWLMVDLEDAGGIYQDLLRLIQIRRSVR